ncbi:DUF58 domain-containing protein [Polycladidibacter hongkongensis]|uniref:DUF58 domain-containing protein n=1 Tax=Polycladidibacter hongkongensis TaxID=1647556 RepID=UPI00082A02F8|nr:DUF58 domain-containing protein [Pseudovibrio hongkongensis]
MGAGATRNTNWSDKAVYKETDVDPRVYCTRDHLQALSRCIHGLNITSKQPVLSILAGRHASAIRGRGLLFDDLRRYQPGDAPNTIDWKVTARTGQPHTRVYKEEKERPTIILVDQRMSMFFGTQLNMKSVSAAETAALIAYTVYKAGDRVGGLVFNDTQIKLLKPRGGRSSLERFISILAAANNRLQAELPDAAGPQILDHSLSKLLPAARRGYLLVIISDFDGITERTKQLVGALAVRNSLILIPVRDPSAHEVPKNSCFVISNGFMQVELDTARGPILRSLQSYSEGRISQLVGWQRQYGVPILPISAGRGTLEQLRQLLGVRRRAVRSGDG